MSQIVHKFWTWSHKCQEKGGKQTDKFLQRDGSANDYYQECERRVRERLRGSERQTEEKSGRFENIKK